MTHGSLRCLLFSNIDFTGYYDSILVSAKPDDALGGFQLILDERAHPIFFKNK